MEIRVLQYFLAITREESISKAAESLHLTQPTLSRQMKELEDEFGKQLFVRGNRKITLTEDGMLLRKRAIEILNLVEKTEAEMMNQTQELSGNIYIGCGETEGIRLIAKVINNVRKKYPQVYFHIYSGNSDDISERLEQGLLDFGIFIGATNMTSFDFLNLPIHDTFGIYMRKDCPLASHLTITADDLRQLPLICSDQLMVKNLLAGWIGGNQRKFNIVSTYNLIYNASLLVEEGCGYALGLKGLIHTSDNSTLCFKPLEPQLEVGLTLAWKKYQHLSKISEYFLSEIQKEIKGKLFENKKENVYKKQILI